MGTPQQEMVALNREGFCGLSKPCTDYKFKFKFKYYSPKVKFDVCYVGK